MLVTMARAPIGRQQLIDAAREELIHNNGVLELAALTLRTGLSTGALYHHFGSKAGLLAAVYDDFYLALTATIADAHLPDSTWAAREQKRTHLFVAYHYDNPLSPVLLRQSTSEPLLLELEVAYVQNLSATAADNIRRGQGRGELSADLDADTAGAFVIGGLRNGIGQALLAEPRPSADDTADRLWRLTAGALGLA